MRQILDSPAPVGIRF